jgi:hypothetical protein
MLKIALGTVLKLDHLIQFITYLTTINKNSFDDAE